LTAQRSDRPIAGEEQTMIDFEKAPTSNELQELLTQYNEHPERRPQIVAEIGERFRRPVAILVLDSCGFTRTVRAMGIIHFLALLERLERLARPIIERSGGRLLKREADNIFAVFPDVPAAMGCAEQILDYVAMANEILPSDDEIDVSLGIGYGDALLIGEDDLYGDEMNLACKLGEDLANGHELLLTTAAHETLADNPRWQFEPAEFSISGLNLRAYRFVGRR
jgi:adenylate cyclase